MMTTAACESNSLRKATHDEEMASLLPSPENLPPLPTPDLERNRRQAVIGITCVMSICVVLVSTGRWLLFCQDVPLDLAEIMQAMLLVEAAIAAICLVGLYRSDPGVIHRDPSLPMPAEVAAALSSDEEMPKGNISSAEHGSFCVRCLVWRTVPAQSPSCGSCDAGEGVWVAPRQMESIRASGDRHGSAEGEGERDWCTASYDHGGVSPHHCRICQRCVANFSHHCGFFGLCIAGKGLTGNYVFFRTVVRDGYAAMLTFAAAMLTRAYYSVGDYAVLGVIPVGYAVFYVLNGGYLLFWTLARFAVLRRCPAWSWEDQPPLLAPYPMVVVQHSCCGRIIPIAC